MKRYRALLCVVCLAGCSQPKGPVAVHTVPATTPLPAAAKLEIDAALTAAGLEVQEKSRDAQRIVLVLRTPKQDHDSSVYSYTLYDTNGAKLSNTGFSVPSFKMGEEREYEIRSDDLAKASRVVVGPFGK